MNPFADQLELYPQPSRYLARLVLAAHAVAGVVLLATAASLPVVAWLLLPVAGSAVWYRQRLGRPAPGDITRLICRPDGTWRWQERAGRWSTGTPAMTSVYTPAVVLLHLRPAEQGHVRTLLLLPDSLDTNDFRRLRARLRLLSSARS